MPFSDVEKSLISDKKGLAVVFSYAPDPEKPPEYHLGLVSQYGTTATGDYVWHFSPTDALTTRHRLPVWGKSGDAFGGIVKVLFIQGTHAKTCSVNAFRKVLNSTPLPGNIAGMMTASWETFKRKSVEASIRNIQIRVTRPDDTLLIEWLSTKLGKKILVTASETPAQLEAIKTALCKPFMYTCEDKDLFASDGVLQEILKEKTRERGYPVTLQYWRQDGNIEFSADPVQKQEVKRPLPSREEDRHTRRRIETPPPQAQETKFDTIRRLAEELKQELLLPSQGDGHGRRQLEYAEKMAATYREENMKLTAMLEATIAPTIKQSLLAHFAGKAVGELDDAAMMSHIPDSRKKDLINALSSCLGTQHAVEYLVKLLTPETRQGLATSLHRLLPGALATALFRAFEIGESEQVMQRVRQHSGNVVASVLDAIFLSMKSR